LEYLKLAMEVMDKYGPSTLKIWPSVEMWLKSKGWGRGMILWHGFGAEGQPMMTREMSGWMSVSDEAGSPLVLFHKALQGYRVNG